MNQEQSPHSSDDVQARHSEAPLLAPARPELLLPEKTERRVGRKIVAGIVGASVGIAGFLTLRSMNDHDSTPAPTGTVATATISPTPEQSRPTPSPSGGEVVDNTERKQLIESLEIPAGLSSDELARTWLRRLQTWNNFGADESIMQKWMDADNENVNNGGSGIQLIDFGQDFASGYADEFGEALFVNPSDDSVRAASEINGNILYYYLGTVDNQVNGAQEGYRLTVTYNSVTEATQPTDNQRTLVIDYTLGDNSDKMGGVVPPSVQLDRWQDTITFERVNNTDKIVSWSTVTLH